VPVVEDNPFTSQPANENASSSTGLIKQPHHRGCDGKHDYFRHGVRSESKAVRHC
jgi:hypothetical protein